MLHSVLGRVEIAQRGSSHVPHEAALGEAPGRPCSLVDDPVDRAGLHEHVGEIPRGLLKLVGVVEQLHCTYAGLIYELIMRAGRP